MDASRHRRVGEGGYRGVPASGSGRILSIADILRRPDPEPETGAVHHQQPSANIYGHHSRNQTMCYTEGNAPCSTSPRVPHDTSPYTPVGLKRLGIHTLTDADPDDRADESSPDSDSQHSPYTVTFSDVAATFTDAPTYTAPIDPDRRRRATYGQACCHDDIPGAFMPNYPIISMATGPALGPYGMGLGSWSGYSSTITNQLLGLTGKS